MLQFCSMLLRAKINMLYYERQYCLVVFLLCVCLSHGCETVHCRSSQFKFAGFHVGMTSDATLLPNSTAILKGYISLKDGTFALEANVAVLNGDATLLHSGVYFLTTTVHFIASSNDTCDDGSQRNIKVAICVNSDCDKLASLQSVSQTCAKKTSLTATGLLFLTAKQVVRVHLFYSGNSPLTIGAASTFSGFLLSCTD